MDRTDSKRRLDMLSMLTEMLDTDGPLKEELNITKQKTNWLVNILECGLDSIIVIDDESNIVFWNQACQQLFGYSAEEAVGKNLDIIIPKDLRSKHYHAIEKYKITGKTYMIGRTRLARAVCKNGKEITIEISISKTPDDEHFVGVARERKEYDKIG